MISTWPRKAIVWRVSVTVCLVVRCIRRFGSERVILDLLANKASLLLLVASPLMLNMPFHYYLMPIALIVHAFDRNKCIIPFQQSVPGRPPEATKYLHHI